MDKNTACNGRSPVVAICYDFDKTLSPKDMQEFGLIEKLRCSARDFWQEAGELAEREGMDHILAYMLLILKKAGNDIGITKKDFKALGTRIDLFPGVESWFGRIADIARAAGVKVEHYIISSGIAEIIEGTSIRKYFKEVYACEFFYDQNDVAVWPKNVVNYTTKTQFVYRINKGVFDSSDNDAINRYVPDEDRRVPFRNMIYIGDGLTDVPGMKVVKSNGGHSIVVYGKDKKIARELIHDGRANFICNADYSDGMGLDKTVKGIIDFVAAKDVLYRTESSGRKTVERELRKSSSKKESKEDPQQ